MPSTAVVWFYFDVVVVKIIGKFLGLFPKQKFPTVPLDDVVVIGLVHLATSNGRGRRCVTIEKKSFMS